MYNVQYYASYPTNTPLAFLANGHFDLAKVANKTFINAVFNYI